MAKPARKLGTVTLLSLFLMGICTLWLAAQCLSLQQKNSELSAEVQRLTASQVILMVPEDQAKPIADWLATHPDETQSLLDRVYPRLASTHPAAVESMTQTQELAPNESASSWDSETTAAEERVKVTLPTDAADDKPQSRPGKPMLVEKRASPELNLDTANPVIQAEEEHGIKVIVLPHGGIRVTTRDERK